MHLRGHTRLVLIAALLCSSSCGINFFPAPPTVVPAKSPIDTDYVNDGVYELRKPVFVIKASQAKGFPEYELVPQGIDQKLRLGFDVPDSTDEYYRKGPSHWPIVLGTLPAGERIEFKEFRLIRTSMWDGDVVDVHPLFILHDPHLNLGLVDGLWISRFESPRVNDEYLEFLVNTELSD